VRLPAKPTAAKQQTAMAIGLRVASLLCRLGDIFSLRHYLTLQMIDNSFPQVTIISDPCVFAIARKVPAHMS
jgi:hypothetical protein